MSFLTRSALLAGSSLKNGAKVSVSLVASMKDCEMSDNNVMKNESEKIPRKRLFNHWDLECGHDDSRH